MYYQQGRKALHCHNVLKEYIIQYISTIFVKFKDGTSFIYYILIRSK